MIPRYFYFAFDIICVSFFGLTNKKFADCKGFTKCNSRQIILLHLPCATYKFLKIGHSGKFPKIAQ